MIFVMPYTKAHVRPCRASSEVPAVHGRSENANRSEAGEGCVVRAHDMAYKHLFAGTGGDVGGPSDRGTKEASSPTSRDSMGKRTSQRPSLSSLADEQPPSPGGEGASPGKKYVAAQAAAARRALVSTASSGAFLPPSPHAPSRLSQESSNTRPSPSFSASPVPLDPSPMLFRTVINKRGEGDPSNPLRGKVSSPFASLGSGSSPVSLTGLRGMKKKEDIPSDRRRQSLTTRPSGDASPESAAQEVGGLLLVREDRLRPAARGEDVHESHGTATGRDPHLFDPPPPPQASQRLGRTVERVLLMDPQVLRRVQAAMQVESEQSNTFPFLNVTFFTFVTLLLAFA